MSERYDVFKRSKGREIIKRGPMEGCLGFEKYRFEKLNNRPVGWITAKRMADECPFNALVCFPNTSEKVYDNGKDPGTFGVSDANITTTSLPTSGAGGKF